MQQTKAKDVVHNLKQLDEIPDDSYFENLRENLCGLAV